jgi:hypothetical protein
MPKEHAELINRIFRLLEKNSNYLIQELGEEPKINKTFLTEYLKAFGNQKMLGWREKDLLNLF